jgi:hypothetical protein
MYYCSLIAFINRRNIYDNNTSGQYDEGNIKRRARAAIIHAKKKHNVHINKI